MVCSKLMVVLVAGVLGCRDSAIARFPAANEVTSIKISEVTSIKISEKGQAAPREITGADEITQVLSFLNEHKTGWRRISVTPPSGRLNIALYRKEKLLCVIRVYGNTIQTEIGSHAHCRTLSDSERAVLARVIDVDASSLDVLP